MRFFRAPWRRFTLLYGGCRVESLVGTSTITFSCGGGQHGG